MRRRMRQKYHLSASSCDIHTHLNDKYLLSEEEISDSIPSIGTDFWKRKRARKPPKCETLGVTYLGSDAYRIQSTSARPLPDAKPPQTPKVHMSQNSPVSVIAYYPRDPRREKFVSNSLYAYARHVQSTSIFYLMKPDSPHLCHHQH
ncbi:hypothetical protein CEXT_213461 [Caerostris extrusa]|uniref:Uncharacterized protein n=1 Tax=Caerostris extrusa TaxID=172846 RepID=A0AAV4NK38_CAEEX|nr:hypothetical protein CEXT_213461 [Caerostris extrusa]